MRARRKDLYLKREVRVVALSREEALRYAEIQSGMRAGIAALIFVICLLAIIVLLFLGEFLWAIVAAALMILAVFAMIMQSRYAEVYREEQARVAAG